MSSILAQTRPRAARLPLSRRSLTVITAASLAVAMAGPAASAATTTTVTLMTSTTTARASSVALAGATVTGKVAIFTSNDAAVKTVRFFLDSATSPTRTEGYKPFDYAGTASDLSAQMWDTSSVSAGTHKITASVDLTAGGTLTTTATFTVAGVVKAPVAPTGLSATAGNAQVSLAWAATAGATSYTVYRNGVSVLTTSAISALSTGLTNGTAYTFAVTATNSGGTSPSSATVSATPVAPAPAAPTGLTATAGDARVSLAWTAPSGATAYRVYRDTVLLASPTTAAYVDTAVVNATTYTYYVTAVAQNSPASAASGSVTATPRIAAPATPTGLAATAGDSQVALTWQASTTATGYTLSRNGIAVATITTTSYTDTGLSNGTAYAYSVAASNVGGTSAASTTVTTTPVAPPAPINPNAMPVGNLPGWTQVFSDDFTKNAALGSFLSTYGSTWGAYPSPWPDTSGNGRYDPAKTLSVSGGLLDIYLHTENGIHYVAAPEPKLPTMTYGRYSIRFQADATPAYKTAWLLWPDDGIWPGHGEIDFPEGNLDQNISGFAHWASPTGGQDAFSTSTTYATWHTATTEWTPGKIVFILDGKVIGTSTKLVPSAPMHWVIQTETQLSGGAPASTTSGHVRIDWATAYTYTP